MNTRLKTHGWLATVLLAIFLVMSPAIAGAVVNGITGTTFNLSAKDGRITMGDGETAYIWGYAADSPSDPNFCPGCVQSPGPTLIVTQGATVTVNLTNRIPTLPGNTPVNTSIVFPGQAVTVVSGGAPGLITQEAAFGQTVTYRFVASQPGTYTYYSGTRPDLQVEMGLVGALIVRPNNVGTANCPLPAGLNPTAPNNGYAYCVKNGYFDREYLFLVSEMDPTIHRLVEYGQMAQVDMTRRHPTAWFVNGRTFPDITADDYVPWLPTQPYSALPAMHPLESVLIRWIGGGSNLHPYHTHGQNHMVIARDGKLLQSVTTAAFADLPVSDYTTTTVAGETVDAIWGPWTGIYLDWDIFGDPVLYPHTCNPTAAGPLTPLIAFLNTNQSMGLTNFDATTGEWCTDHGKPIPVLLPDQYKLTFGQRWGGTPDIGIPGDIPPIDPNNGNYHSLQNPMGALAFMWHSHNERELTTNNIFIGGMATFAMVMPYSVTIP